MHLLPLKWTQNHVKLSFFLWLICHRYYDKKMTECWHFKGETFDPFEEHLPFMSRLKLQIITWPQYFFSICFVRHDVGAAFVQNWHGATCLNLSNVFRKYANFVNSTGKIVLTVYPTLWFQRSVDETVT